MSLGKMLAALGLVTALCISSGMAQASESRSSVASKIKSACSAGASSSCIATIKAQLARASSLGKTPDGLAIAQGLADAVAALGTANPDLGTQLATIVATDGANFVQVAFGAVLDGTGTASNGRHRGGGHGGGGHHGDGEFDEGHGEGHGDDCKGRNCPGSRA
jgi:hypothetical protein